MTTRSDGSRSDGDSHVMGDDEHTPMAFLQASSLMKLGISGPRRPVDDLIDRLSEPDHREWLESALSNGPAKGMGSPDELLIQGRASVTQLERIKEHSKSLLARANQGEARLAGIAGYFLSIAAGLHHHGKLIGGRGRSEMSTVLLDLATVAPEPYATLLSKAALSPSKP